MNADDTNGAAVDAAGPAGSKPGRPRKHASDADRVRAHRERKKERELNGVIAAVDAATPGEAVGTLESTVEALRGFTSTSLEQFNVFARQITAAVDKLSDPAAIDAELHRAAVELAQARAGYEADLTDLRARLETAVEDRANADAAVDAVDAQLIAVTDQHKQDLERVTVGHLADIEHCRQVHAGDLQAAAERLATAEADRDARMAAAESAAASLRQHLQDANARAAAAEQHAESSERRAEEVTAAAEQRVSDLRAAAQQAADTASLTIARLEESSQAERAAASAARERSDSLRDDLEQARVETSQARSAESSLRERVQELRAGLGHREAG